MNKKLMAIAGTVALGSLMLGATAYAAVSGTSGYDLYKQAFKNTYAVNSITPKTQVVVKDNGDLLFKVDAATKLNKENETMSNIVTVASGDQQKTFDIIKQNDQTIFKTSDSNVYDVSQADRWKRPNQEKRKEDDPSRIRDIENVVDALAGNIQNYITSTENPDGTKDVSLALTDNQVSPVVNAAASLAVKNIGSERGFGGHAEGFDSAFVSSLQDKLPKLVDNIRVSHVDVDAVITKDNLIKSQVENLTITGTDANGKTHEIAISVDTGFSGYNSTTPDTIDLTGKQVKTVTRGGEHREE